MKGLHKELRLLEGEERKALRKTVNLIGKSYVSEWYKKDKESLNKCLEKGGLTPHFKKITKTIKKYIKEEPELLTYFAEIPSLNNRLKLKTINLLESDFIENFNKSDYTKNVVEQMSKLGINYRTLNDNSIVYSSHKLAPYYRELRKSIYEKIKDFDNSEKVKQKIVNMRPDDAIKLAKKLEIEGDKIEYSEKHLIELNIWKRDPRKDMFIGCRADACICITEGANFDRTLDFLKDPGTTMIEIRVDKKFVGYSRVFPVYYKNKKLLYLDYFQILTKDDNDIFSENSDNENYESYIREYLVSMLVSHGKKAGFNLLCSGGFELHHIKEDEYGGDNLVYKNLIKKLDGKIKKFGYSKSKLIRDAALGDYPDVGYLIKLK